MVLLVVAVVAVLLLLAAGANVGDGATAAPMFRAFTPPTGTASAIAFPANSPVPSPSATPTPSVQNPKLHPFENLVGWAYSAVPGVTRQKMQADMARMRELGANVVYICHPNPGMVDVEGYEPGLSPAVWFALREQTPRASDAERLLAAVRQAVEVSRDVGLFAVLSIGYQIQMGPEWNALHPEQLRRNADGTLMNHLGSGMTASPYSPQYRADITEYYRWVNRNLVQPHRHVIALNLSDEPMGADYSGWAKLEFANRYGLPFDLAIPRLRGDFQSGVISDYAIWSAGAWMEINPAVHTMMTFHVERKSPFFPDFERLFAKAPPSFIFSADTHLQDGQPDWPLDPREVNLLYGMVRTLGWMSHVYERTLMLWTSANSWGLATESVAGAGIDGALHNLAIVNDIAKQPGGKLGMIMAWGWNIKGQGIYRDDGALRGVSKEDMVLNVAEGLRLRRDSLSRTSVVPPEKVVYLPSSTLYESIGQRSTALFQTGLCNLPAFDFTTGNIVYLTDGPALDAAKASGARIVSCP